MLQPAKVAFGLDSAGMPVRPLMKLYIIDDICRVVPAFAGTTGVMFYVNVNRCDRHSSGDSIEMLPVALG